METHPRARVASGILLILLGLLFLSYQMMPGWWDWLRLDISWPLIVIGVGLLFLVFGLLTGTPALAVPACVISGIGALLYWQNATGNWGSWAYVWTLIPGFVGVGVILAGLLGGSRIREALEGGSWSIFTSLVMFAIFGSFLGGLNILGIYWPVLLIVAGVLVMARALIRR
jgi:hypothetical protein